MIKRWREIFLIILLLFTGGAWLWLQKLNQNYREEPYTKIEDGLYSGQWVSTYPPGAQVIINLCDRPDTSPAEVLHHKAILDAGPPPSLQWLKEVVDLIASHRKEGKTVYIHCAAGVSRSGLVTTAYLMQKYHWNRDHALRYARSRRPQINPRPAFLKLLKEWEQYLEEPGGAGPQSHSE